MIHHGIRFDATLPAADALVTEASLGLLITSLEGEIRVGDWGRVPEPSTFFLITTGALGLVGLRRRMRRSRPRSEGLPLRTGDPPSLFELRRATD